MALKFFQIPIREFQAIEMELNAFLRGQRVLSVDRRWVDLGQDSLWAICIDYLDSGWNNDAANCRTANRNRNQPTNRTNNLGFRVALAPLG